MLQRRELVAGVAALLVLLAAAGRVATEPLLDVRDRLGTTNERLAQQIELTEQLVTHIGTQVELTREMRDTLQRSLDVQLEGLEVARAVREDTAEALEVTRHLLVHAHDLRDAADALRELVRLLVVITRDLNSKFPDNPSGHLPPP